MLLDKRLDMTDALLLENLVDSDENTRFLDVAKAIVYGCAEELHRR